MRFTRALLVICILIAGANAQDLSFKPLWSNQIDNLPVVQISGGFGKIFLPLPNGTLRTIDSKTGKIIWSIELGGEFLDSIKIDEKRNSLFALTIKLLDEKPIYTLQSIDADTGITKWQKIYEPEASEKSVKLLVSNEVNVISTNLNLVASDNETGRSLSRRKPTSDSYLESYLSGHFLFEIKNRKEIVRTDLASFGLETRLYRGNNEIRGNISFDKDRLYFSDNFGIVYSLNLITNKVVWKSRLGAETIDINPFVDPKYVLAVSKDIYFYRISKQSGKKNSKTRLESSSFGEMAVFKNSASLALTFDSELLILDSKLGRVLDRIRIDEPLVFPCIVESDIVIAVTPSKIVAFK